MGTSFGRRATLISLRAWPPRRAKIRIFHLDRSFYAKLIALELTNCEDGFLKDKKYLIMDRDATFSRSFRDFLSNKDVQPVRLPPRSPNLNAHRERFFGSLIVLQHGESRWQPSCSKSEQLAKHVGQPPDQKASHHLDRSQRFRSKQSRFITLFNTDRKSLTNYSFESSDTLTSAIARSCEFEPNTRSYWLTPLLSAGCNPPWKTLLREQYRLILKT